LFDRPKPTVGCSASGRRIRRRRNRRERDHLEDPGLDGRIILRWIFRKWDGGMNWIDLAQDRDRWRAVLNAVMSLRVP
jgi:hypothetical protein